MAVLAAGLLASGSLALLGVTGLGSDAGASTPCGPGGELLQGLPGPAVCVHADIPPPGVDVTDQ